MSLADARFGRAIFDLPYQHHRELRVRAFLTYFKAPFPETATPVQLLSELAVIEGQFSDTEKGAISPWLGGAGLLSDFGPTLRKAQALGKRVSITSDQSPTPISRSDPSKHRVVPLVEQQECSICLITLAGIAFPRRTITPKCRHGSFTCLKCLRQCLRVQINEVPSDHIACPECPAVLAFERVKEFASLEAFRKYDRKITLAKLQVSPNFVMCSGPNCDSGQIHTGGRRNPIMRCNACRFRTCFKHKTPWHTDFSCEYYELLHKNQAAQEAASVKYLSKHSKICPNPKCGLHVDKIDGCDHIYCTHCHHEFCWSCLAAYDRIRKEGNSAHAPGCKHSTAQLNVRR